MILENPALKLNIGMQDILEVLESTLKEKNWEHFELANLKLTYIPFYIFNYDTLIEQKIEEQTLSEGFNGLMAMNAITGKLEPLLTQIMNEQAVDYEKKIEHELQYEMQNPSILGDEAKQTAKLRLAGQFKVGKDSLAISGMRLVYWPIWKIFVTLSNKRVQRIEVEAVSGYPMNIEEVPEREKTWMEVTGDTLKELKTAKGWAKLSKTTLKTTGAAVQSVGEKSKGPITKMFNWLLYTKIGRYVLIGFFILLLAWAFWPNS